MAAQHTAGPWAFSQRGQRVYGGSSQGLKIAQLNIGPNWLEDGRLIAAAPDLVKELIALRKRFHAACIAAGSDPDMVACSTPDADAAIARALGEEK